MCLLHNRDSNLIFFSYQCQWTLMSIFQMQLNTDILKVLVNLLYFSIGIFGRCLKNISEWSSRLTLTREPSRLKVWAFWHSSITSFSRSFRLRYLWLRILSWWEEGTTQRQQSEMDCQPKNKNTKEQSCLFFFKLSYLDLPEVHGFADELVVLGQLLARRQLDEDFA